jgi:epoxyqueuosine reductase
MTIMGVEQEIRDKALELGFDAVGITDVARIGSEHVERFEAWRQAGCAGRMEYMHRNVEKRFDPAQLRKGAQAVIVVALNYKPPSEIHDLPAGPVGRVAMYAQYEDYHLFIKDLLRELAGFLCMKAGRQDRFKICVDSAPVAEKALAVRAGLGFIGKNHLLIHPQLGPQLLLGELLTSVPLQPDRPTEGTCLGCNRCMEACPTGALRPDGFLDARRCISYLTQYEPGEEGNVGRMESGIGMMEHWNNGIVGTQHSSIPVFQHSNPTRDWLFGCDECLRACPFHQKAPSCANRRFQVYPERAQLNLQELLELTAEAFEARFRDSPIRRLGLEMLKYNARRCLTDQA